MNYQQAMISPDREAWEKEVENEYLCFEKKVQGVQGCQEMMRYAT
jgi:hypothetical protein